MEPQRAAGRLGVRASRSALRAWSWVVVSSLLVVLVPGFASATDVWTEPNPGIRHLHRTTPAPAEFHALVVDLTVPGVQIRCTPTRERWKSTSAYARDAHLAAAINGGFWGLFGQGAQGLAAGAGTIWSSDDEELGFFAYARDGRAMVSRPSDIVEAGRRGITDGVSGRPLLVDRGRTSDELANFPRTYSREPRTAVGVSVDGHHVILVTVDGRRTSSHGGTLVEVAQLMIELGAYRAINLDGGGSTTMYVAEEGGVVNRPSRGWEREVVNHIGIVAPSRPAAAAAAPPAEVRATPDAVVQQAIRSRNEHPGEGDDSGDATTLRGRIAGWAGRWMLLDRLGLGRRREIVVPILFVAVLFAAGAVSWALVRRLLRRRNTNPVKA